MNQFAELNLSYQCRQTATWHFLQHVSHVVINTSRWFVCIIQSAHKYTNNGVWKPRSRNSNPSRRPAPQRRPSMGGDSTHFTVDASAGRVAAFRGDSPRLYNQHRAPLTTDPHSRATLLMFPLQMSLANQTDFNPAKLFRTLSRLLFPFLTNQLLCGRRSRSSRGTRSDEFKNLWLVFSFNSGSRAYPSKH